MSGFDHAGIEGFLSLFSAGLGLWSYRKELQHHQQNLQMAKRQHDEIKELERRMHKETKAMNKKAIRNDKKLATAVREGPLTLQRCLVMYCRRKNWTTCCTTGNSVQVWSNTSKTSVDH
mmetsp:Transcript_12783/g.24976  ORF Transcript_12783/g.24976 Transcript_12783/m.24976 type:complete len:119 (+) Transcript_12783:38-394(+)